MSTGDRDDAVELRHGRGRLLLVALLALVFACLAGAGAASARAPAICDEYPDLPVCSEDTGGDPDPTPGDPTPGDSDVGSEEDAGVAVPVGGDDNGGAGTGGTGSGGELPFTGYPLTPLLLLLLLLLAIGIAIRAGIAVHDRLRQRGDAAALPPPA